MSDTVNTFKSKLTAGNYKDITGARRAIGKYADVSEEEYAEMHKLANKHFGAEPAAAKGSKEKGKAPAAKRAPKAPAGVKEVATPTTSKKRIKDAEETAEDADRKLTTLSHATTELLRIGEKGIDVSSELQKAQRGISAVLDKLVGTADALVVVPAAKSPAPAVVASSLPVMPGLGS